MDNNNAFVTADVMLLKRTDADFLRWVNEITGAFKEVETLSDRAAAVLGFALLEEALERLARQVMVKPKSEHFGGLGFLSSASARINALYQFGVLPAEIFEDLTLLRQIRNDFSHGAKAGLTFDSPQIVKRAEQLRCLSEIAQSMKDLDDQGWLQSLVKKSEGSIRNLFVGSALSLVAIIEGRMLSPDRRTSPILIAL